MANIVLEDSILCAEFDPATGALAGLLSKATGWRVQGRPELGLSFRMMAPLPQRRNNQIHGNSQPPPTVEVVPPGRGPQPRLIAVGVP